MMSNGHCRRLRSNLSGWLQVPIALSLPFTIPATLATGVRPAAALTPRMLCTHTMHTLARTHARTHTHACTHVHKRTKNMHAQIAHAQMYDVSLIPYPPRLSPRVVLLCCSSPTSSPPLYPSSSSACTSPGCPSPPRCPSTWPHPSWPPSLLRIMRPGALTAGRRGSEDSSLTEEGLP